MSQNGIPPEIDSIKEENIPKKIKKRALSTEKGKRKKDRKGIKVQGRSTVLSHSHRR